MYTRNAWAESLPNDRLRGTLLGESTKIKQLLFVLSSQGRAKATNILSFFYFICERLFKKGCRGEVSWQEFLKLSISRRAGESWMSTPDKLLRLATKPRKVTFFPSLFSGPSDGSRNREHHGDQKGHQSRRSNCTGPVCWWHPGPGHTALPR